jgi:hypothetical protein
LTLRHEIQGVEMVVIVSFDESVLWYCEEHWLGVGDEAGDSRWG